METIQTLEDLCKEYETAIEQKKDSCKSLKERVSDYFSKPKENDAFDRMMECRLPLEKEVKFNYTKYPFIEDAMRGSTYVKGHFRMMTPDQFLHYCPAYSKKKLMLHPPAILEKVKDILETGKVDVGFLEVGKERVFSHEGRHTMCAAKILGINEVVVYVYGEGHRTLGMKTLPQY